MSDQALVTVGLCLQTFPILVVAADVATMRGVRPPTVGGAIVCIKLSDHEGDHCGLIPRGLKGVAQLVTWPRDRGQSRVRERSGRAAI